MHRILITLLLAAFSTSVNSQTYQVVVFSPSSGFNETRGTGLYELQRVGAARISGAPQPEDSHAVLWIGDSQTPVDLNPAGFDFSIAADTDGLRQVGTAYRPNVPSAIIRVAALWSGTAGSFVPLCALPYCGNSVAYSVAGDQQVGFTDNSTMCTPHCTPFPVLHAALWRGTPQSYVDLHPVGIGCERSFAFDTDGTQQVGYGTFPGSSHDTRALLWFGTSGSLIDLSPAAFQISQANAVRNGVQAGYGQNYIFGGISPPTALVWRGSAASVVALGPGVIEDTNGSTHVGTQGEGPSNHAFRWDGDTGEGFDLHSLLPPGVYSNSGAEQIDSAGNIIGWAQRVDTYYLEAVLWRVVAAVPNSSPDVWLSSPRPYSTHGLSSFVTLTGHATDVDGSITSVEFIVDGQPVGSGSMIEPDKKGDNVLAFEMLWKAAQAGRYRVQARATDNLGAVSYSRPSVIYVVSSASVE